MLAQSLAELSRTDVRPLITQPVRDSIQQAFLDTTACIVAGRRHPASIAAAAWARSRFAARNEATVLFGTDVAAAPAAAFVNAVSGHALEYDDAAFASHPSVVLVSAIWADHERNPISGSEILAAYAKGYEAWAQLNGCVTTPLHRTGWHPTAVFGTLAATVALASVRRLDETATVNALGLAASFSSGVVANFGSMTKPVQVGFAVERAFTAVDLASHGVTASPAAIDGPGGLLGAVNRAPSGSDAVGWNKESLTLSITPPSVKKYPVCFASHRVVDGVLDVRGAHGIRPEDVVAVHATISESSSAILTRHDSGDPAAVATFSLKFAVAAALTEGRLGLAEVSEAMVRRDAIRELMAKVTVHTTRTQSAREPTFALADRVTITMRDGRELDSGDIHFARGSAESALNVGELDEKVESCMAYGEPDAERAQEIRHRVASALEST